MGCSTSKQQQQRCRHCQRSFSMPSPRTSSFIPLNSSESIKPDYSTRRSSDVEPINRDSSRNIEVFEAKTWSRMIGEEKAAEIVHKTPPGEPECINAKELMEGLEEDSSPPLKRDALISDLYQNIQSIRDCNGSNSDNLNPKSPDSDFLPEILSAIGSGNYTNPKSLISDFDPNSYRKSPTDVYSISVLEGSNPKSPISVFDPDPKNSISDYSNSKSPTSDFGQNPKSIFSDYDKNSKSLISESVSSDSSNSKPLISDFDPNIIATFRKAFQGLSPVKLPSIDSPCHKPIYFPQNTHKKSQVVIYFTSLRGVRKTYEDCCSVRSAIKCLGFKADERDVSMHSAYKEELKVLLKRKNGMGFRLPMVFAGEVCIGGAEEVLPMHEGGRLQAELEGCETEDEEKVCGGCGDVRFVPCETCCGSCKVYEDKDGDSGFRRCRDCNENGIIRCPTCCCSCNCN